MPVFNYSAVDSAGEEVSGVIEADSPRQARNLLRERGLFAHSVGKLDESRSGASARLRIGASELTFLTRQWATLIAAGLTIEQTLKAALDQSSGDKLRRLLLSLRAEVTAGHALSNALELYPEVFPPVYRALVRAGEKSGALERVLTRLADYLESRDALRQKIIQALLYPLLVTLVATLVIIGLMTWVVPQVIGAFAHSKQALPLLTQMLIWASDFLRAFGIWLLLALIAGIYALRRALRGEAFRLSFHLGLLRVPVLGRLLRTIDSARFAQTLAILIGGGVPILAALEAGRRVLWLSPLQNAAADCVRAVSEGESLARALDSSKQFPPLLIHLIAGGEKSGDLPAMLERASAQQQSEVAGRTALLTGILEPLLVVVMGGVVLLIVLAVMQPILQINQLIK